MANYKYIAVSDSGKTVRGNARADSQTAFYAELRRRGLYCVKVKEAPENTPFFIKIFKRRLIPRSEMAVMCRQMASMTASGVTINRCLDVLYRQSSNQRVKHIFSQLYESVQKGSQLSDAMADTGGEFEPLVVNMVRAGENSGRLDRLFSRLADYYEREIKLRGKTALAMLYPAVLGVVTLAVVLVLFVVVLPSFVTMFQSFEDLPWYTRMMMGISDFIIYRWYIILGAVIVAVAGVAWLNQNEEFLLWRDEAALKLPIIGKLRAKILFSRFCHVFASLFTSGVPVLNALELSRSIIGNRYVRSALKRVSDRIQAGTPLSASLGQESLFPEMMLTMIMVGEESGELDAMLVKTSDYYDGEAESAIQKLIGLIQPVMIVCLGLLVAFVMLAVLNPIYTMYRNI